MNRRSISFLVTLFIRGGGAVFGFALTYFMTRYLGVEETGRYFLCYSIVFVSATLARFGLDNTLVRFFGALYNKDNSALKGFFIASKLIAFSLGTLLAILILKVFIPFNFQVIFDNANIETELSILIISVPFLSLLFVSSSILKGLHRYNEGILLTNVILSSILVIAIISGFSKSATDLSIVYLFSVIGTYALSLILLRSVIVNIWKSSLRFYFDKTIKSCLPLYVVSIVNVLNNYGTTIILGIYMSEDKIGEFVIVLRISVLITLLLETLNGVVAPKISKLWSEKNIVGLQNTIDRASKLLFGIGIPSLLILFFGSGFILNRFFEVSTNDAILALRILLIGQLINLITGSVGTVLMMVGEEKKWRNLNIIGFAFMMMSCVILTPSFGLIGTALGIAGGLCLKMLWAFFLLRSKYGFSSIFLIPHKSLNQ